MSDFVVSARKYRPQTFDSVVGQEAITSTLKAAIRNDHLAQAFLFCGPRGVGKTSCARILARTINCENLGADFTTCGNCDPCKSFEEGHSLNIYELDAASNNSVENIRDLTLQVNIAPQVGTKKVYIIDEVHMLSSAAFNAFLKTLEEPPSYAIFILATTEKHKILPTIISRCQVFDFRRIGASDIVGHLGSIASDQGIEAEEDALMAIATKADGGMRDALSIFDQLVSYTGEQLTYQDVTKNLNILDHHTYFEVTKLLLSGDTTGSLVAFDEVLKRGFDGHHFIGGLGQHMRNLLVVKDDRSVDLLETSDELKRKYIEQSKGASTAFIFHSLERLSQCDVEYRASKQPRLLVELALIRCSRPQGSADPPAGISKEKSEEAKVDEPEPAANGIGTETIENESPNDVLHEAEEPETHEPPFKRRLASGISINDFMKEDEVDPKNIEVSVSEENTEIVEVDPNELKAAWKEFAMARKAEGKNSLCATMLFNEPRIHENMIGFNIVNEVQELALREVRLDLLATLRRRLNAPALELELSKEEVGELKPRYTAKDRFRILAEKNPDLNTFKDKLKLDI